MMCHRASIIAGAAKEKWRGGQVDHTAEVGSWHLAGLKAGSSHGAQSCTGAKVLSPAGPTLDRAPQRALTVTCREGRVQFTSIRCLAPTMSIKSLDHIQLAMPPGREAEARDFYQELLGIPEVRKPANLAKRGGCWFECGALKVHLGVEGDFRPARKAHPAFIVDDLAALSAKLSKAGYPVRADEPLKGYRRVYVDDPFGNRIELMQPDER
jgi:catechol 2,3-dioxygenase-like lactoylglutathione lyase family enzyme